MKMPLVNMPDKAGTLTGCYNEKLDRLEIWNGALDGAGYSLFVASVDALQTDLGAKTVAHLMEQARDVGYQQAQRDIQRALGLNT
jgi:hypothetical protein